MFTGEQATVLRGSEERLETREERVILERLAGMDRPVGKAQTALLDTVVSPAILVREEALARLANRESRETQA